jgi:two-component system, chemotaxis family, response regulator PixH
MRTVLIVEDSLLQTQVLTRYLQQAGLGVVSVTSGEEVQDKLNKHKLDLIILDVILPGQSGFELCRELKTDPHTRQIPVVICSTKNTEVDKMWGNMLGADAYLPKPVDRLELIHLIQQLMKN